MTLGVTDGGDEDGWLQRGRSNVVIISHWQLGPSSTPDPTQLHAAGHGFNDDPMTSHYQATRLPAIILPSYLAAQSDKPGYKRINVCSSIQWGL